jgi:hypothetical protein
MCTAKIRKRQRVAGSGETRDQARRRAGEWAPGCTRAEEVPEEKFPTEVPCA